MNLIVLSFLWLPLIKRENIPEKYLECKSANGISKLIIDTTTVKKKLHVYKAIPCIDDLLKEVTKANHEFYDPKTYFYTLSFKKVDGKRYMVIEVNQFKSSRVFDYVGVIKISGSLFLCRGDIASDTLFKKTKDAYLQVSLTNSKKAVEFDYGLEPSLRGLYQECGGIKINLEIYTRATLPGYHMKE